MNIVPAIPGNVTALTEHAHTHLFWDFETRSTLDLTEVGAWRYATPDDRYLVLRLLR